MYNEALAEAVVLRGLERLHPEVMQIIGHDGRHELQDVPLKQFVLVYAGSSTLPKTSKIVDPPTQQMQAHYFASSEDLEFLIRLCSNFIVFTLNYCIKYFK